MQEHLQTLHESYRTELYGPWHTRECDPEEHNVKALECVNLANKTDSKSHQWFLQQAKNFQDRANHIRQEWATREGLTSQAIRSTTFRPAKSLQQSSNSLAKQKRNQKTRPPAVQEEEPTRHHGADSRGGSHSRGGTLTWCSE